MADGIVPDVELDCVGLFCPMPIAKTKMAMDELEPGQVLKVEADDPGAELDIQSWAKRMGHELLSLEKGEGVLTFYLRKRK